MKHLRLPIAMMAASAAVLLLLAGCSKPTAPRPQPIGSQASRGPAEPAARIFEQLGSRRRPELTKGDLFYFYPLQIGNLWSYTGTYTVRTADAGGGGGELVQQFTRIEKALVGTEALFGRSYTVESSIEWTSEGSYESRVRYRQDRSGLYEADVYGPDAPPSVGAPAGGNGRGQGLASPERATWEALAARITDPARRAAYRAAWGKMQSRLAAIRSALAGRAPDAQPLTAGRGLLSNEITRLRYPLDPKQGWIIRGRPPYYAAVEGHDLLRLPAGRFQAVRIRYSSPLFGPNDAVRVWYGRDGFLQLLVHAEGEAVDDAGNPLGRTIYEASQVLNWLWIGGPPYSRGEAEAAGAGE